MKKLFLVALLAVSFAVSAPKTVEASPLTPPPIPQSPGDNCHWALVPAPPYGILVPWIVCD